jgi:nitric oxide reductase large subunit
MRMPGDIVFSLGAVLMAWDFLVKLRRPAGNVRLENSQVRSSS